jgi:excisionase family DNA binding protein
MMTDFDSDKLLTSHQVGELLQVNPSSINKWVNDGRIPAFRTPGGHRRIRIGDLVSFLDKHKMPVPRSIAGGARRRLLVVDDDQKQLDAVKRKFKAHIDRVELITAANGIDALVAVGSFKPHLLVLDVYMPGEMDGLEVCRRLKDKGSEMKATDILITTGLLTADVETEARKAGAAMALSKPIDIAVLLEHLGLAHASA